MKHIGRLFERFDLFIQHRLGPFFAKQYAGRPEEHGRVARFLTFNAIVMTVISLSLTGLLACIVLAPSLLAFGARLKGGEGRPSQVLTEAEERKVRYMRLVAIGCFLVDTVYTIDWVIGGRLDIVSAVVLTLFSAIIKLGLATAGYLLTRPPEYAQA